MLCNTRPSRQRQRQRQRGFTLLEMLAVIVLLAIVASVVVRQIGGGMEKGKFDAGKTQLSTLGMKVDAYELDVGTLPASLDDLLHKPASAEGWHGPYAKPSDLKDPFGHSFGYRNPGEHGRYDLVFYGQDGKPGGDGYKGDVGNWQ